MAALAGDMLIETKKRRLAKLEQQAAALGYDTSPQTRNEIEDLQREIAAAAAPTPTTEVERYDSLRQDIAEVRAAVWRLTWLNPILMVLLCGLLILLVKL
jgi:hypothetical protein